MTRQQELRLVTRTLMDYMDRFGSMCLEDEEFIDLCDMFFPAQTAEDIFEDYYLSGGI